VAAFAAFSDSGLASIHISSSVEVICEACFRGCKSLASVTFDSNTKISRFDGYAFSLSGLMSIYIPSSAEMICEHCFFGCKSLASAKHDPGLKLRPPRSGLLV
jgi:predicted DsbA family dithiol-disulfide isomerase